MKDFSFFQLGEWCHLLEPHDSYWQCRDRFYMWSMGYIDDYVYGECDEFEAMKHGSYVYILDGTNSSSSESDIILETCSSFEVSPKTSTSNNVFLEYSPYADGWDSDSYGFVEMEIHLFVVVV